jgi:cell division septum initiation protein DivIVA
MNVHQNEIEELTAALAGARARIEELAANGRRIIALEDQIAAIRTELDSHQATQGAAEGILDQARSEARRILEGAQAHGREIAARAEELVGAAEHDADLLRAAALEEGSRKTAALLDEARLNAHEIRLAAQKEAARIRETAHSTVLGAAKPDGVQACTPEPAIDHDQEQPVPAMFRARKNSTLPRLGIEETDIWAKAARRH